MKKITVLNISEIVPGKNDRTVFDQAKLQELADSICEHGLIQPISVRALPETDLYEIVAGERRWRACQLAGLETIQTIILDVTEEEASALMLTENVSRADLDPIDEALAYQSRMDRFGWTVQDCAERAGVSTVRVRFRLKLLSLRPDLQKMVRDDQLPIGYAQILSDGDLDNNRQLIALRRLRDNPSPTPAWFRKEVGKLLEEQAQEPLFEMFSVQVATPKAKPTFVEPPHPATTLPPATGDTPRLRIIGQIQFWRKAAEAWDRLGKSFKRQECEAAATALTYALNAL